MEQIILPPRTRDLEEELLTPSASADVRLVSVSTGHQARSQSVDEISSAQDVLTSLKAKPDIEALQSCLDFLVNDDNPITAFHIRQPGPLASQIIFVLVNEVAPSYWQILTGTPSLRKTWRRLIKCLRSSAGIPATVQRLKVLLNAPGPAKPDTKLQTSFSTDHVRSALELLECLLHGDETLRFLWADISRLEPQQIKRTMLADSLAGLLASGNLLSVASQADLFLQEKSKDIRADSWVAHGRQYASWLGRNILHLSIKTEPNSDEARKYRSGMLAKGLRLGYNEHLIGVVFSSSLEGSSDQIDHCREMLNDLPTFMQTTVLSVLLRLLAGRFDAVSDVSRFIGGSAALLKSLVRDSAFLLDHLAAWLTDFVDGNVDVRLEIFRAVIVLISDDLTRLQQVFETSLEHFGSKYLIQRSPALQQETQTKVLLLLSGYVQRADQTYLQKTKSSSNYLNAISNRLAASSPRLQFFGMVVGMAVSDLVDKKNSTLKFDTEEIKGEESQILRGLTKVKDSMGAVSDLKTAQRIELQKLKTDIQGGKTPAPRSVKENTSKIMVIEEIEDTESEDDLPVYAKPDSDPEDSDEDPTVITRNKPTAPVYIRDLLAGLRADDNYDRHKLAVENAASLIRRKTGFGTEVLDHVEELAEKLVGLKDSFNFDDFQQKRLQAMIAVIIVKPVPMGKWFANTYFNGDYSISQRAAILSALAFAARELAGLKDEDADMTGVNDVPDFPSNRLPEKYARMWQKEVAPVNKLVGKVERDIIKPMALLAADKATGPNALKVRTFSSRMEVEKKRKRAIPNELAKVVAEGFFYPLTGRWSSVVRARGDASVFTSPFLLSQFLRTLALILGASGSSTLSLPGMTTEFWGLLMSLRKYALTDQSILEAVLFANLTLLEINSNDQRQLAENHAQELMETQQWVQPVFENLRGGPKEEERIKMLASALLIKVKEIIDHYKSSLMGPFAAAY